MFQFASSRTRKAFTTICIFTLLAATALPALADDDPPTTRKRQQVSRSFDLDDGKAGAIFLLLSPDNVRVLVSRTQTGINIKGTPREVNTLTEFIGILTRDTGKDYNADPAALAELRKTWNSEKTYTLPQSVADALFVTLAFNDVPVYVTRTDDGINVQAVNTDQKIIAQITQIARGEELKGDKSRRNNKDRKHDEAAKGEKAQKDKEAQKDEKAEKKTGENAKSEKVKKVDKPNNSKDKQRADRRNDQRRQERKEGFNPSEINRPLADRVEKLARRVAKLEQQVAELSQAADESSPHADAMHHHDHPEEAAKPKAEHGKRPTSQLIDRRYRLPKQHADNLFALFAPADITDIVVSREGNQLRIRASEADHKTIERLVDLLTRGGEKKRPNKDTKKRTRASN